MTMVAVRSDHHPRYACTYVYVHVGLGRGGEQACCKSQPEHQQFFHDKPLVRSYALL